VKSVLKKSALLGQIVPQAAEYKMQNTQISTIFRFGGISLGA